MNDRKNLPACFEIDLSSAGISSMVDTVSKCNGDARTAKGLLAKPLKTRDPVKTQSAPGAGKGEAAPVRA